MNGFIIMLAFLSFLNPFYQSTQSDEICIESRMGGKANYQSAKMLAKKYGLHHSGFGMKVDDKVEGLYLTFDYYGDAKNINEVRQLLYSIVMDHLSNILANEELRPYRADPFTLKNISITIIFHKSDGYDVQHPAISIASFYYNSTAFYRTIGPGGYSERLAEIEESAQQFFNIVEGRIPPPVYQELQ